MNNSVIYDENNGYYIFKCPYCDLNIQVIKTELNCLIFRHGILKKDFTPINPHLSKSECDRLAEEDLIYGCGKPFRLLRNTENEIYKVEICNYI